MNQATVAGGKLALICLVSALVLGLVHALTAPVAAAGIAERRLQDLSWMAGSGAVDPESIEGVRGAVKSYYTVRNKQGDPELYILRLRGSGRGGELSLLASFKTDGEIVDVVLRDSQETPGLGKQAEDPQYMVRFIGRGGAEPIPTRKAQLSRDELEGVSGSTLTFLGIARALEEGAQFVRQRGGEE